MITFRLKALNRAWTTIHQASSALKPETDLLLHDRLNKARRLAGRVPVNDAQAMDLAFASSFVRRRPGLPVPLRQVNLEKAWERFARDNYAEAARIAQNVLAVLAARREEEKP
jgi:hypothetical protein